jgi:DNA-binding NtrC family response regulator
VAKSASTVWLLDDDPSVLKANGRLLASAGWEVERFIDPDAFLRHAEIHHPRVVVIDMWMPRMDGLEVQRRLSGISPSTRVIVLTANDDRIVRWKALAAGAAAFSSSLSVAMSFSPAFDRPLPRIEASLRWRTNKERLFRSTAIRETLVWRAQLGLQCNRLRQILQPLT